MKNNKNSILGLLFISLSMLGLTVVAATPDEQMPAEETICDSLKADGVSKGLYGLCVAFCEAQDYATISVPTTEAEFDSLETYAPSGRILANYNKKKQPLDPAMPCIVVQSPCPCITAEELAEIDGLVDGVSVDVFNCKSEVSRNTAFTQEWDSNNPNPTTRHIAVTNDNSNKGGQCQYLDFQSTPDVGRQLSEEAGTLTAEEVVLCRAMISDHCSLQGF